MILPEKCLGQSGSTTQVLGDTTVPQVMVIDVDSIYWIGAREDKKLTHQKVRTPRWKTETCNCFRAQS
jgi:hypothetical protein